jgi:hypothetical protein
MVAGHMRGPARPACFLNFPAAPGAAASRPGHLAWVYLSVIPVTGWPASTDSRDGDLGRFNNGCGWRMALFAHARRQVAALIWYGEVP